MPLYNRILITGAAGSLGSQLRAGLKPLAAKLRLSDREDLGEIAAHEEAARLDLSDFAAVMAATEGVDGIVHFGGAPRERKWEEILASNIRGGYNIFEAARLNGARRIVFASSVHAIGYHELGSQIDAEAPHRPDSLYGLSKCFVEDLGRLYWDKFGIESAHIRIFSSFPEPQDRRMLWSYLSFDDLVRLVSAALTAPHVGHSVAFGMSDNKLKPVDNRLAGHLGYHAQDSSEPFRAKIEAAFPPPDAKAATTRFMGGWFVDLPHPDDPAR